MISRLTCASLLSSALVAGTMGAGASEVVIPIVVKRTAGVQESMWETRVQVLRMNHDQDVVVRRRWVALREGGFVDDPVTGPRWTLEQHPVDRLGPDAVLILTGEDLLADVEATHGAVGLVIEGEAHVQARVANAGAEDPPLSWPGVTAGAGQLVPAQAAALTGPAVIPWGGQTIGCVSRLPGSFRTNIGLVNPNQQPLRIDVRGIAYLTHDHGPPFWAPPLPQLAPITVVLRPLGWTQLNDVVPGLRWLGHNPWGDLPCQLSSHLAFNVVPENDSPYYAYVSVVYSEGNDPEFISASPGNLPEGPEDWIPRD